MHYVPLKSEKRLNKKEPLTDYQYAMITEYL